MERLRIRISGTIAKARRKSAKVEFFVSTEKISKEKSIATWKAMPNVGVYMIENSAPMIKRRYITQMTFWCLVILRSSFFSETMPRFSSDSSFTLF